MWKDLFGDEIQTKKHGCIHVDNALGDKSIVGLYFSASWCSPCREFTPVLSAMYEKVVADHPDFEIVYISSDQSSHDFEATYADMPFAALPFKERQLKAELVASFRVPWVPFLVFVNANGDVLERDGRRLFVSAKSVETVWDALACD